MTSSSRTLPLVVGATLLLASHARAALGGSMASVATDSGRMGARMSSTSMGRYARHELTRTNGGTVRELTNADGQVFAVTWSGPGKPDLRALLGQSFKTFQAANAAGVTMHALRRPPQVNEADLQIQTSGHMGWFHGVALIPSLAPSGFSISNLRQEP